MNEEEEFGTPQEREQAICDIEKWVKEYSYSDTVEIAIVLTDESEEEVFAKTFTPRELARDIREETVLGVVFLDIIMSESRKAALPPVIYAKAMTKVLKKAPGELVKRPFFEDEVN